MKRASEEMVGMPWMEAEGLLFSCKFGDPLPIAQVLAETYGYEGKNDGNIIHGYEDKNDGNVMRTPTLRIISLNDPVVPPDVQGCTCAVTNDDIGGGVRCNQHIDCVLHIAHGGHLGQFSPVLGDTHAGSKVCTWLSAVSP